MSAPTCTRCRGPLSDGARFCPACGAATVAQTRRIERAETHQRSQASRRVGALIVVFGGVLAAVILAGSLFEAMSTRAIAGSIGFVVTGLVAIAMLGPGAARASAPLATSARDVLIAVPVGLVCVAVAIAYVHGVRLALGVTAADEDALRVTDVVAFVVLAPLVEEWLVRGVAWFALRELASPRATLWTTSALFALMHGLQGGLLVLPHRLFGGLVLGWLRQRSDSIVPGIVAHAVWNACALLV